VESYFIFLHYNAFIDIFGVLYYECKIAVAIAMVALAITLATATTAVAVQIVFAQADDSEGGTSTDQLTKNCQNGNAYACGQLNGNPANVNPKSGVITQCQQIPNEPPLCTGVNVDGPR
jgi:hypothetical protein